jgi:hypothetical protein
MHQCWGPKFVTLSGLSPGHMVKMQQNDMHVKSFSGMAGMVCCSFMGSKAQQAPMLTPSKQGMIIVGMAAFKRTEARGFVGIMQVF